MSANSPTLGEASQNALGAFWRDHGPQWAEEEASPADLEIIAGLSRRIAGLNQGERESIVVRDLKAIWQNGFSVSAEGFGWDEMNDQLPASALVAFVDGAREHWEQDLPKQ